MHLKPIICIFIILLLSTGCMGKLAKPNKKKGAVQTTGQSYYSEDKPTQGSKNHFQPVFGRFKAPKLPDLKNISFNTFILLVAGLGVVLLVTASMMQNRKPGNSRRQR